VAQGTAAVIGWAEGEEHRTTPATLIDISLGGFAATVETFPPPGKTVWLRLDGDSPSSWVKAAVIETITTGFFRWARRRVRLRFLEGCPYDFFKAAIEGFSHQIAYPDDPDDVFHDKKWR